MGTFNRTAKRLKTDSSHSRKGILAIFLALQQNFSLTSSLSTYTSTQKNSL